MKKDFVAIEITSIQDVVKADNLDNCFMVFDNFSDDNENFPELLFTDYPIKLNVAMIVFCTAGRSVVRLGLHEYAMEKNCLMVVYAGQIMQTVEMTPDFKGGFMFIDPESFALNQRFMEIMSVQEVFVKRAYYRLIDWELDEILAIYGLIKNKIKEVDNIYRFNIIQQHFNVLFYNICNALYKGNNLLPGAKNRKEELFERFLKEVKAHYRKEKHIKYYADIICLTPKYLSSLIYEVSGKLAGEWIKDYVLLEAKALLKSSYMTIQQVSDELNFSTPSHFGRFFKQHTGMSPREYKKL